MKKEKIWKNKNFWEAVATLVGTIIGAGILGIPFVVAKVGVVPGMMILVGLGFAVMVVHLMIAELMLRTRFRHQLAGLVKKYLGVKAEFLISLSILVGSYGALTAYMVGEGEVLSTLFGMPDQKVLFSIVFFAVAGLVLLIGLKLIKILEYWMVWLIVLVVFLIIGLSLPEISRANLLTSDWTQSLMAYGVFLFAFSGMNSIFSVREILRRKEYLLRRAIVVGSIIPMVLYACFASVVVGVTGVMTSDIATIGIGQVMGYKMVVFGNIFAVLAMATSFFTIGISLRQFYHYDYKVPVWLAWLLVLIVPVLIFFFVEQNFIEIIGVVGSITFGLAGVLVVFAFWKAKKTGDQKPVFALPKLRLVGSGLILVFVVGMIYTISQLF